MFGSNLKDLYKPNRKFLYECETKVLKSISVQNFGGVIHVNSKDAKDYLVYVFNDMMLLARPQRVFADLLKVKATFNLMEIDLGTVKHS
jgi:hypothetical protein